MYILTGSQLSKLEETTFAELHMHEDQIEEILRNNVDMICDDEESMLIVGQQVSNRQLGRSDLTAIDQDGNLVLIEIKRDKRDIEARKEPFEIQAIRYAASCATIQSVDDLVKDVFAPYVRKHRGEFGNENLTEYEIAKRVLDEFISTNEIARFNEHQRIVLVASEFDEQTLSAVAWLNSNQVDISCYRIIPSRLGDSILLDLKKILPVADYEDFYVNVISRSQIEKKPRRDITRRTLPKINALLEWGVVHVGDTIVAKSTDHEAVLLESGKVQSEYGELSLQQWLKAIFGWASVQTYAFSVQKASGKTLSDLREEYMENLEKNEERL